MTHKHKCPNLECGHLWEHSRDPNWTREQFLAAHTCEKCGAQQTLKHDHDPIGIKNAIHELATLLMRL